MSKERGTFLIEFIDGEKVIFGNNYKTWWQHAVEYIYYNCGDREKIKEHGWRYEYVAGVVKSVKYSKQPFTDDGGLKWCNYEAYQDLINEVAKKYGIAPFKASDVVFYEVPKHKGVLTKKLKEY